MVVAGGHSSAGPSVGVPRGTAHSENGSQSSGSRPGRWAGKEGAHSGPGPGHGGGRVWILFKRRATKSCSGEDASISKHLRNVHVSNVQAERKPETELP